MDLSLSAEHRQLREVAREFTADRITPHAARWDRDESIDRDLVPALGGIGFLGIGVPEEHGGSGGDHLAYCLVLEELAAGDSAVRGIVSVSLGLVAKTIARAGADAQRERWLPGLCSGALLGCFALTEPDTGSDAGSLAASATRVAGGWRLSGRKVFITNGTWADVALVFARTGGPGPRGVTAFLVPTDSPGFTAREIRGKLGMRGQATAELLLDDVPVPDDALLGEEGGGFALAMAALDRGRMSVAAGCVGAARGSLEAALRYAREREQFGRPIAGFQLVQELLADMAVETDAARLLTWRCADLADRGEPFRTEASMAKLYASEASVRVADRAVQVLGGYGYLDDHPVAKHLRDTRVTTLYEGTSQIQRLLIGRALTGVSAFT
ncbi:acyl-CoA dehydrogenase family protein [Actinosynnema pretiosum subsp. pretiosum]|uniref:Acyl-CoA dehydrogenase family protein n=1 Tax=Actinosynnema pretiosum subsp. pretiosum TaxID=103721 RepID=A0AA45LBF2_9PSEU|nr:Acyl-CoA dehydrogenase, short-chain specific [Actinosynnema pretiosum subsp. pretiosum]QUF06806.1 acyl-CoA dehydrogenase family protein [Actinosynnema pretiosum subsp. pretiosum]